TPGVGVLPRPTPAPPPPPGLVERGLLRREEGRILGIFPTTRWPAADSRHEGEVRRTLTRVLRDGVAPDERTGALVAMLAATKQAGRVMAAGAELSATERREIDHRAKELAEGSWAAGATRRYVEEITAATTAALTTTMVIAGAQS
ncbi:GPP34 family phosphoprotein, partial [Oerskovia sp. NPDC056781]|uniref:GOLPH3/VPS74 family protein n=1 Tax=Oerskovia sp. NPDC056781 TaxID=3345942 RepID=UPI003671713B